MFTIFDLTIATLPELDPILAVLGGHQRLEVVSAHEGRRLLVHALGGGAPRGQPGQTLVKLPGPDGGTQPLSLS